MDLPAWGEVWWADLPDVGARPVVILSRDAAILGRRRAMMAPCSTNIRGLPTEVVLEPGEAPVERLCAVHLDSTVNLPVRVLTHRLGRLADETMREVCGSLAVAAGCAG